jgi:hypothetical protein
MCPFPTTPLLENRSQYVLDAARIKVISDSPGFSAGDWDHSLKNLTV